jgi:CheY-like chemotaxis protein
MTDDIKLVYLVHNNSDVLLTLYDDLSGAGFRVAASSSAMDALAYLARMKPHCVIYRWELPQMEGREFIDRAKTFSPGTRIIVSSQNADGRMYDEIRRLGGDDLISEPFNSSAVIHALSRMAGLGVPNEAWRNPAPVETESDGRGWNGTCRG